MLRNVLLGHSLAVVLALTSAGCGQKKDNDGPKKKGLITTMPKDPSSNAVLAKDPEPVAAPAVTGIYQQVPAGVAMVVTFNKPEQTIAQAKDLAKKFGGDIEADPEFQKNREEFKTTLGVDILDPELFKKVGIDSSQGIAVAVDTNTTIKKAKPMMGAAATRISQDPIVVLIAALASAETFDKTFRDAITKEKPDSRFEDVTLGEKDKLTFLYQTHTEGEAKVETLKTGIAQQGGYLYVFLHDEIEKSDDPAAGNPIEEYKTTVKTFLEKKSGSVTADGGFSSLAKTVNTQDNLFVYMDLAKFATAMEAGSSTIIYGTPKDDQEKAVQEDERKYQEERKGRQAEDAQNMKTVTGVLPQFAMSFGVASDKLAMKGAGLVGTSSQEMFQKALVPAIDAPAYATIFPENTALFYRSSLSLAGIKEMVFNLLPAEEKAKAITDYAEAKAEIASKVGLDLDADILGGFTGHTAFGAESAEVFTKFAQEIKAQGIPTSLPKFMMVSQFSSPEVGDKLLAKMQELIGTTPLGPGAVKAEDVNGDKLYTLIFGAYAGAWGRSGNVFFLGTDIALVKESMARVKTPGASFAEKLPPLAKSLATGKNTSGLTVSLGALLLAVSELPDISDKETLVKLGNTINNLTMSSFYNTGQVNFEGEMTLK